MLRSLGAVGAIAFVSLWAQLDGLIGSRGILPWRRALDHDPLRSPTLLYLADTDLGLHALAALGTAAALGVAAGIRREGPLLLTAWACYLSLATAGQIFLAYQWDALLIELLALGALTGRWSRTDREVPRAAIWLFRFTLFKLMLGSGLVKLLAADGRWVSGEAMAYHYWTQPLPNPLAPWAHALPATWHQLESWLTLAAELMLPLGVFGPRAARRAAFLGFTGLLAALFLTGNYGFFQPLTMVLVLALLDDRDLPAGGATVRTSRASAARAMLLWAALIGFVIGGTTLQVGRVVGYGALPAPALSLARHLHPWRTTNGYGLFGSMTTARPELLIEGSVDGLRWRPYVFRYKPGPLQRPPPVAGLHMPRLDWQLWFAALRGCQRAPWLDGLLDALARGEPAVLGLLDHDPFDGARPIQLRVRVAPYRFDPAGGWQIDGPIRPFCPTRRYAPPDAGPGG